MPNYSIIAKNESGQNIDLIRASASRKELLIKLREANLIPIKVELIAEETSGADWLSNLRSKPNKSEIQNFMSNFSTLLRSGMDIERCLRSIERESKGPIKGIVNLLQQKVKEGTKLSEAMIQTRAFGKFQINIIQAGEFGGNLHQALSRIVTAMDREMEVRSRIKFALAYPLFVVSFGILSALIMVTFILPRFTSIYKELGAQLPLLTRIVLAVSDFCGANGIWFFPIVLLIIAAIFKSLSNFRHSVQADRIRLSLPMLGSLLKNMEISAFLRTFGILLQSGLPITQALKISAEVSNSAIFSNAISDIEVGVQKGGTLSHEMRKQELFSETVLNLISVGEESGQLEELMLNTAEDMEKKIDRMLKGVVALLEPILIILVGIVVGIIVLAMLLPVFSLSASLRK